MVILFKNPRNGELDSLALYFALAVPCVLGSRMLLNLREVASEQEDGVVDSTRQIVSVTELSVMRFSS